MAGAQEHLGQAELGQVAFEGPLRELEEVGLSAYEARLLLALMRLGSADTQKLARLSGVPRTSIYPVLHGLEERGMAERVAGEGPAVWACEGHEQVVDRLEERRQAQFREQQGRISRLRHTLSEALPRGPSAALPYVRLIPSAAQTKEVFERLFSGAGTEILAFSKRPYSWRSGEVNPAVLATLERGVPTRAIYEAASLEDPQQEAFRRELEAYIEAGVEARVLDELPIKLVIADRERALVAMTGPGASEVGYPTNLLIEHCGFAELQADAFERRWAEARPYSPSGGEGGAIARKQASARREEGPPRPADPEGVEGG